MTAEIQLINIEEELKRLWDLELGQNRTRACFFNLVIYIHKTAKHCEHIEGLHAVLSKFPCRVILITSDDVPEESLKTSVKTVPISEGIFCEIIQVDVSGALHERVPYIILPHILPDLPLYLLWTKDPYTENLLLPTLAPFADRIIFDTEKVSDLQTSVLNICKFIATSKKEVGDLHWSASKGWRKIFASLFDTPENYAALQSCKTITLLYNQKKIRVAAYFQAWLASCLNWNFKKMQKNKEETRLLYTKDSEEITLILKSYDDPLAPLSLPTGALIEVDIDTKGGGHFVFKRNPTAAQVYSQYSDHNRCDLPKYLFLSGVGEGLEIIEEIFYPTSDKHYRKMLEILAQIPWESP